MYLMNNCLLRKCNERPKGENLQNREVVETPQVRCWLKIL